jgi:hypothetical protein
LVLDMKIRTKKIIAFLLALVTILVAIIILLSDRGSLPKVLHQSPTVVKNTQLVRELNHEPNGSLVFFTGTGFASTATDFESATSLVFGSNEALPNITFAQINNKITLFKTGDKDGEAFENKYTDSSYAYNSWYLKKANGRAFRLNELNLVVVDAKLVENEVVALDYNNNSPRIVRYNPGTNQRSFIDAPSGATQVIAANKNWVATMDKSGKISILSKNGHDLGSLETNSLVTYDEKTSSLYWVRGLQEESQVIGVYKVVEGQKNDLFVPLGEVFYSAGYIFVTAKTPPDNNLYVHSLVDNSNKNVELQPNDNRDPYRSIVVADEEPLTLLATTIFDETSVFGIKDVVSYKESNLSMLQPTSGLYDYDLGRNSVYFSVPTSDSESIKADLLKLKANCACDINQVKKFWFTSEEYTGDGVPPEEQ